MLITEEKGSDVNLATYLIHDALTGACETSIVMSNDSDLTLPIDLLGQQGHPVGVVNPHPPAKASSDLRRVAAFYKQLRQGTLAAASSLRRWSMTRAPSIAHRPGDYPAHDALTNAETRLTAGLAPSHRSA